MLQCAQVQRVKQCSRQFNTSLGFTDKSKKDKDHDKHSSSSSSDSDQTDSDQEDDGKWSFTYRLLVLHIILVEIQPRRISSQVCFI